MTPEITSPSAYKYVSFEEYLALEERASYKSEYEKGRILAMSGGTLDHSTIAQNVGTAIANELRKQNKKCRVKCVCHCACYSWRNVGKNRRFFQE